MRSLGPHRVGAAIGAVVGLVALGSASGVAQDKAIVLDRDGRTIVLEPYAANIIRITLSDSKTDAVGPAGYGFVGTASGAGWVHQQEPDGSDVVRSARLVIHIAPDHLPASLLPHAMPLDPLNASLREHYFGKGGGNGPKDDDISVTTPSGKTLLEMRRWSMYRNGPEAGPPSSGDQAKNDAGSRISATFDSPAGEHYYGLGQQQQGFLDLRDHQIRCWQDYSAIGGQNVCVPFMVSSRGYGLIWDNPSKTTISLGFNQQNTWSSEVGDRVSFFVIAGENSDEIYTGYRQLTGVTHMLPKAGYGYIQSKAIYPSQEQLMAVANGYRERKLPLDVLVVDFLNMTRQGEMDLDSARWPDAAAMNDELHARGITTMLSVWPHFAPGTRYYDMLRDKGWLIHKADGTPDPGYYKDVIGPNIDTTNPEAAKWWWDSIRDRYIKPDHFDYIWLDETEPDIDPEHDFFYVGSGRRFYNVYPLFHTASVYEGFRRDFGDSRRVMSLARAAYLGAQRNGTVFWSSDIVSTWDMLKRSVPAGLNFAASGMPYWDTDIAGFFSPQVPANYHAQHRPLIDGSDVRSTIGNYEDYPELYVRWFEWGAFQPVMRSHGERDHNEPWSYGRQAEQILAKFLRLRYQLMPYTYSLGYASYKTGAPFMRALFMDFPDDPNVSDVPDEYMFGPAFLVAPVTEQGATKRGVYLPAGCDWYNYWSNERLKGGQTIVADAPVDQIPLFVRAGSIVPLGSPVENTAGRQEIASVRVYPGADAEFTLFSDDGTTYAYEKGTSSITKLHWDEAKRQLRRDGAAAWSVPDNEIVEIVRR